VDARRWRSCRGGCCYCAHCLFGENAEKVDGRRWKSCRGGCCYCALRFVGESAEKVDARRWKSCRGGCCCCVLRFVGESAEKVDARRWRSCRGGCCYCVHCLFGESGHRERHAVCVRHKIRLRCNVYRRRTCHFLLYCPGVHGDVCAKKIPGRHRCWGRQVAWSDRDGAIYQRRLGCNCFRCLLRRPCIREANCGQVKGERPPSNGSRAGRI